MEDMAVFKSYLREHLRALKDLKEAITSGDLKTAEKLINKLIEDAQKGIED